jgi:hypothetical protein
VKRARIVALALLLAAGCATPKAPLGDIETWPKATAAGVIVHYKEGEVGAKDAAYVAEQLRLVRDAVALELAPVESGARTRSTVPPYAEVLLYRDAGWGQERWLVTHAAILERPLRVRIPCALAAEDQGGEAIAARIRETVAHEVAEATVLTNVPVLDPYLRWFHDGVAESVGYRVLRRLDANAADEMLARYEQYAREERRGGTTWVDLTRWRQLPDWILHSDLLFKNAPLRLDDLPGSLRRVAEKRFAAQERDAVALAALDALIAMLSETWVKEQLPYGPGEADLRPRAGQFLCYDAGLCLLLELERAHPGVTAETIARIGAREEAVLRSDDVVAIIASIAGEDIHPRLERFTLDRLEGVLAAERRR